MEKHKKKIYFLFLCICMVFFSSCGKDEPKKAAHQGTPRDHTPSVLIPEAPGTTVIQEGNVTLDVSNISEGYFMVLYTGSIQVGHFLRTVHTCYPSLFSAPAFALV